MTNFARGTPEQHLRKRLRSSTVLDNVQRIILPLLAIAAILFSSFLSLPDAHAAESKSFAHAADHVLAHGADHFDAKGSGTNHEGPDQSVVHHHNCSFSLADNGVLLPSPFWFSDNLKGPLAISSLASRAPPVLIQPPKA